MNPFALLGLAYLMGAIPTSYWVGRVVYGIDLRVQGSGNLGATNALRILGWKAALPVVLFDVTKGFVPVHFFPTPGDSVPWGLAFGGAAIVGHVFSVWVRFRGGKGVATGAGVLLGLAPGPFLIALGVWLAVMAASRLASLASILAAISVPLAVWLLPGGGPGALLWFTTTLAAFIIWAHRSNIGRLLRGEEGRIVTGRGKVGQGAADRGAAPP